jgi:hypothetical protein
MAVPHSPQNFADGAFCMPQAGHRIDRRDPHSPQNLRPASFSVPQVAQVNGPSVIATPKARRFLEA